MRSLRLLLVFLLTASLLLAACGRPAPSMDFELEQVGRGLRITVQTTGFLVSRDGHVHIRINDGPEVMAYTNVYTIPNLEPGRYEVWVDLSDRRHKDLGLARTKSIELK